MSAHTPGPWTVEWPDDEALAMVEGPIIRGAEGQLVAEILSADLDDDAGAFATHDAALVHASPDLLKALKGVMGDLAYYIGPHARTATSRESQERFAACVAAIAKATGGSRG